MPSNTVFKIRDTQARLSSFLDSSEFADATIICGAVHFKVHKIILAVHSDYFAKAFQVDAFKEGKTGEIVLQAADPDCDDPQDACDDPEAIRQMVVYFYKNKYEDGKMLMMNAKAFALAVKYQIPGLRKLAEFKFQKALTYKADDELLRVAHYIYHSTTDDVTELRDQIVSELLARSERVRKTPEGQLGLRSIPGIAFDLLELTTKRQMDKEILCLRGHHFPESVIEVQCPFCNCRRPACWYCYETWKAQYCKACGSEDAGELS